MKKLKEEISGTDDKDYQIDLNVTSLQLKTLKTKLEKLQLEKAALEKTIELLYQSNSWKITAPFRCISSGFSSFSSKLKLIIKIIKIKGGIYLTLIAVGRILSNEGYKGLHFRILNNSITQVRKDYSEWIRLYSYIDKAMRNRIGKNIKLFTLQPKISILMPVFNTPIDCLNEAIWSVRNQIYGKWELCIADDDSSNKEIKNLLRQHQSEDSRIKIVYREINGNISAASNSALKLATGEFVGLLDHDDTLSEDALYWVVKNILDKPDVAVLYSDEDKIDHNGHQYDPYFKCDFNPELFLAQNMISHFGVYRRDLMEKVGGFRIGFEGAQDYDLALRFLEVITKNQIIHIPKILYHWRAIKGSTAMSAGEKNYAVIAGRKAVQEHLDRRGIAAKVESAPNALAMNRIRFALPNPVPIVSIIIPTRDQVEVLETCISSILKLSTYPSYEIIIIDNGSVESKTKNFFESLPEEKVSVIRDASKFNFSKLNNVGAKIAKGQIICLMNNDIEIISEDWLEEMVSFAHQKDIGCVGAKLLYPDGRLQHAGVITGLGGVAGHSHKYFPGTSPGYFYRANLHQSLSAVTAACLLVRRKIYEEVSGLDEIFSVAFNDVDFCLRVEKAGYRNVWTPYALMVHHESISRGAENTPEKQQRFLEEIRNIKNRWGDRLIKDPAYSPNLTLEFEDFSYAWPPRVSDI